MPGQSRERWQAPKWEDEEGQSVSATCVASERLGGDAQEELSFGCPVPCIRARRGEQKAILAVAHELLTIIFHILREGGVYKELGEAHYDQQNKPKVTRKLVERLQRMGYSVTLQPVQDPAVSVPSTPEPVPQAPEPGSLPAKRRRGRPCKFAERGIACQHAGAATPLNPPKIPEDNSPRDSLTS